MNEWYMILKHASYYIAGLRIRGKLIRIRSSRKKTGARSGPNSKKKLYNDPDPTVKKKNTDFDPTLEKEPGCSDQT